MKWIDSKTQEPPKDGKAFLGCHGKMEIDIFTYDDKSEMYEDYYFKQKTKNVTHWMKLPKLPK